MDESRLKNSQTIVFDYDGTLQDSTANYITAFKITYNYFIDMYCTEAFGYIPKYDIFQMFRDQYIEKFLVVGDRIHDFEIGHYHNIVTIGCNYGFGTEEELQKSDIRINNIHE